MESKLYGRKIKMYGATFPDTRQPTTAEAIQLFENSTLISTVYSTYAIKTGNQAFISNQEFLYKGSIFQNNTASKLDNFCQTWQLVSVVFYNKQYTGIVPYEQAKALFPNAVDISDLPYNWFFFTDDDIDVFDMVGAYYTTDSVPRWYGTYQQYEKSGTSMGSSSVPLMNYVLFVGDRARDRLVKWIFNYIIDVNAGSFGKFNTMGLGYSIMDNNWYLDRPNDARGKFPYSGYQENIIILPDNPYEPGGPSGPTDPNIPPGTFDDDSDPIPDSPLPTLSAANTGFTRIYNPTLAQVQQLAQYLWTTPDIIETIWNHIKQFFENPMDAIIGFNLVPVPVPDGGTEDFTLMFIKTGVMMTVASNQFVDLDCGTLELKRYYGSALDQSPYTKVSCYLPYIGTVNLNTDEVIGTTLQVKYRVDIVSGSCVAKIFVDGNCLYQYSGHCAITIPISSADFSSYVSAAISVGKLAAAAITAGAGAAMVGTVGEVAQQTNQVVTTTQVTNTERNPATGRQITTGTTTTVQTRESPADQSSTQASFSGLSPQNISNTVGAIMSSKPHIEHSGSFSGNSGYLGVRRPFVIIERPNMCMPANYQALNGFPSMITMELSTCKGFTRIQQVQLTGLHATNPEQAEILELLKSGVVL